MVTPITLDGNSSGDQPITRILKITMNQLTSGNQKIHQRFVLPSIHMCKTLCTEYFLHSRPFISAVKDSKIHSKFMYYRPYLSSFTNSGIWLSDLKLLLCYPGCSSGPELETELMILTLTKFILEIYFIKILNQELFSSQKLFTSLTTIWSMILASLVKKNSLNSKINFSDFSTTTLTCAQVSSNLEIWNQEQQ